jgi:hypothetical protein
MENTFADLLERLGYDVLRKRDTKAREPLQDCRLMPPFFAPPTESTIAFSLKAGNFANKDIQELVEKVANAKKQDDEVLKKLKGKVLVTNYSKTEAEIEKTLKNDVYCWDIRRLVFYSAKAEAIQTLARKSEVEETRISNVEGLPNSSYLRGTVVHESEIVTTIIVFVDIHKSHFVLSSDHMTEILRFVYDRSLEPLVRESQNRVNVRFEVHTLGLANEELARNTFFLYSSDLARHPKVLFRDAELSIFQYGSAPWAVLFRKH